MCSPALHHHLTSFTTTVTTVIGPPAAPRRLSEVAGTLRITEGPRGPRPEAPQGDLLDPNEHHGWRAAMRLVAAGKHRVCVVIGPPQDGKDTNVSAPLIVWAINDLRRPVAYCTTDKRLAGALWRAKVETTMRASGYGHLFPEDGQGSAGGTPGELLFTTGVRAYLLGAGASNGGGQAGVTVWLVIITEADKIRIKQREWLQDRNKSYAEEKVSLLIGTIDQSKGKGRLFTMYGQSTMGRMHHCCRTCGAWQTLEPDNVVYDKANAELARSTARYKCRAMGCLWTEDDRKWSCARSVEVYAGQTITGPADSPVVTGAIIPAEYGGLRIWALDSPFRSMPQYAAEDLAAREELARTGDEEKLRAFTQSEQCLPYESKEQVLRLRESDLALRSSLAVHGLKQAPEDADTCAVAIDQQHRRLIFVVMAYRSSDANWWIVDHDSVGICAEGEEPTAAQFQTAANKIQARVMQGYTRPSGHLLRPQIGFIDTADGITRERALTWLRGRVGWYACRGDDGDHDASDALGDATLRLPGVLTVYNQTKTVPHWQQFALAVNILKGEVMRDLTRQPGTPGAGHLPKGEPANGWLIKELCAEHQEQTAEGAVWVLDHRNNHRLDCTGYAKAGCKYIVHLRTLNSGNTTSAADYASRIAKG